MEKSAYNIEKITNNGILIYNTFTGAVISLEGNNVDYYQNENFEKIPELNSLVELGIIVRSKIDEKNEMKKLRDKFINGNESLYVTILPTTLCNLRCVYCFESIRNITMNDTVIEHMIPFIKDTLLNKKYKHLHVSWFGGEPLYYPNLVKKIYKQVLEVVEDLGINFSNSIVTNGTFLDEENIKMLSTMKNITSVQVTVDGCKKVHDLRKPMIKSGSYDKIIENLKKCVGQLPISLRINVDKTNYGEIESLIKELSLYKGFKEHFKVYFARVIGSSESYTNFEFATIRSNCYKLLKKYGFIYSIKESLPEQKAVQCSALTNHLLVFDSNGDIYTCWEAVGNQEYKIGDVYSGISNSKRKLQGVEKEECHQCKLFPICHTGCPKQYKEPLKDNCLFISELLIDDIEELIVND